MDSTVVFLFRPRRPGDDFEVWHVLARSNGQAQVIVGREQTGQSGAITLSRPFGAPIARLARLVEEEADRVSPAAPETAQRLRALAENSDG